MKINALKNLDVGVSNIEIEGRVKHAGEPRNFKGEKNGKQYNFWSQFIVVEDDTDSIGCNINFGKEEDKLKKFEQVKIRGKIEKYMDKNNNTQKKLTGYVIKSEQTKEKEETNNNNGVPNEVWEKKDLRIARQCAIKATVELVVAGIIEAKDLFASAEKMVNYIYNGYSSNRKNKSKKQKENSITEKEIEEVERAVEESED